MRVSVIADLHCRGPSDPSQRSFVEWLGRLEGDELWLLGDILHFGWVFDGRVQPAFQEVVDALVDVRKRGIHILFIPGNHDFAVAGLFENTLDAEVRDAHVRTVDGVRFSLSHGDDLDRSWAYRFFRWVVRARVFSWGIDLLGPRLGSRMLSALAGGVSPGGDVWDRTRKGLLQRLNDAAVVIVGHIHTPWSYADEKGRVLVLTPGVPVLIEDGVLVTEPHG